MSAAASVITPFPARTSTHENTFPHLVSAAELARRPAPTWLLEGWLPRGGLVVLYGPSGVGKSFLVLDWSLAVATARGAWLGQRMQHGSVLYIAGEGEGGIQKRITAWQFDHGVRDVENWFAWDTAVNLRDGSAVQEVIAGIHTNMQPPALIVVDTLARCMEGDENSSKDMKEFIGGADTLRRATGATVLVVHHTGKDTTRGARGHSSLHAAADTMLALEATGGVISLTCLKQKDGAPPSRPWELMLSPIGPSAVLKVAAGRKAGIPLGPNDWKVLKALAEMEGGATNAALRLITQLDERAQNRVLKGLAGKGYVTDEGTPRSPKRRYFISEKGAQALDAGTPDKTDTDT